MRPILCAVLLKNVSYRKVFAARKPIEIALALNLEPCFAPVDSSESNVMAEAFAKTFKRDYVRITAVPGADTALALIENWMEDYNTVHPHSRLVNQSLREHTSRGRPKTSDTSPGDP